MRSFGVIFFLQVSFSFGQMNGNCFTHYDPLSYDVGDKISFSDSTFEYEFIEGLARGIVKGKYTKSGDSIILSSEYQQDDFLLITSLDSSLPSEIIELEIKLIEYSQVIQVGIRDKIDSVKTFEGKTIWHSSLHSMYEKLDTVVVKYEIPNDNIQNKNIEVIVYRKNASILIPIDHLNNSYCLDLTRYPTSLDYRFFDNKYALLRNNEFYFLDRDHIPEKDFYLIRTRKGVKVSKKKKIKTYKKCI
jgi:hypothetical protein